MADVAVLLASNGYITGQTIKINIGSKGAGVIAIPGLVKIEKVPASPTWPAYINVSIAFDLLPGSDCYCADGLHAYFESPAKNNRGQPICGACGKDEIDWGRLHERDIADIRYTIAQLNTDRWQHKWWFRDVDAKALQHASRKGLAGIRDAVRKRVIASAVARQSRQEKTRRPQLSLGVPS